MSEDELEISGDESSPNQEIKKQPYWELTEKRKENLRRARDRASELRREIRKIAPKEKTKTKLEKRIEQASSPACVQVETPVSLTTLPAPKVVQSTPKISNLIHSQPPKKNANF
jgi:hypothetical protein